MKTSSPLAVVVTISGELPRRILLGNGDHHVGRLSENEIPVSHPSLSRRHALVRVAGGVVVLKDLDSRNGAFLADKRVREMEIREGDSFRCGDATFTLTRELPDTSAAPSRRRGPRQSEDDATVACGAKSLAGLTRQVENAFRGHAV